MDELVTDSDDDYWLTAPSGSTSSFRSLSLDCSDSCSDSISTASIRSKPIYTVDDRQFYIDNPIDYSFGKPDRKLLLIYSTPKTHTQKSFGYIIFFKWWFTVNSIYVT